jgi:UDP-sugar transporter A1/2/3
MFQVLYQSKLIITASLSALFLNSKYNTRQWVGLFLVTVGVTVVVTFSESRQESSDQHGINRNRHLSDTSLGVILVFISCVCSSLAGVYFEALIKNISPDYSSVSCCNYGGYCATMLDRGGSLKSVSVWMRNIQLSVLTLILALFQEIFLLLTSHERENSFVATNTHSSFLKGFTLWVYLQVWLLGGGGLVVAIVIKYTDNVQKGIATGLSVIVSTLLSNLIFGTVLNRYFSLGTIYVLLGLMLFNEDLFNYCRSRFRWFLGRTFLNPIYIIVVFLLLLSYQFSPIVNEINKESPFLISFSDNIVSQDDDGSSSY